MADLALADRMEAVDLRGTCGAPRGEVNGREGEAGSLYRLKGFLSAGYAVPFRCGTGGIGCALDLKAFRMEVNDGLDPFLGARKPGVDPIDVPAVTREVLDPLLNLPRRGSS